MSRQQLIDRFIAGSIERIARMDALLSGSRSIGELTELLGELHTLKGEARMLGFQAVSQLAHALEEALLPLAQGDTVAPDTFDRVSTCFSLIRRALKGDAPNTALDEARAKLTGETLETAAEPEAIEIVRGSERYTQVPSARVDDLCERLLELQSRLGALEARGTHDERAVAEEVSRCRSMLDEITSVAWSMRLVSVEPALRELASHARELATASDKSIEVVIDAGGVHIERSVLDVLLEPMLHIVRNAVDHGIDSRGEIVLQAAMQGNDVLLVIEDDGQGIDDEAIRKRLLAMGVAEAVAYTQEALREQLFRPGFSTRSEVSDVSGRGIGLDVARRKVEALGGTLTVASHQGLGTRFSLLVPASLAEERVLVVRVGQALYGFTSRNVQAVLDLASERIDETVTGKVLLQSSGPVPLRSLDALLGGSETQGSRAVVIDVGKQTWAFSVGDVVGEQALLRRPVDALIAKNAMIGASATLPDGRLVFLLRTHELTRKQARTLAPRQAAQRKKRVLVVDDSPIVRELLEDILHSAGYDVATAGDGRAALTRFDVFSPDLVLSDVEMPVMNGFELLRAIRAKTQSVPVVMVTTRGSVEDREKAMGLGASALIIKSDFEGATLIDALRRFLEAT